MTISQRAKLFKPAQGLGYVMDYLLQYKGKEYRLYRYYPFGWCVCQNTYSYLLTRGKPNSYFIPCRFAGSTLPRKWKDLLPKD